MTTAIIKFTATSDLNLDSDTFPKGMTNEEKLAYWIDGAKEEPMLALACLNQVEWEVTGELKMSEEKMREEFEEEYSRRFYERKGYYPARIVGGEVFEWFCIAKTMANAEFAEERAQLRAEIAMQAEALKELVEAGNSEDDNAFYAANAKANRVISAASADCEAFMQAEIVKRLGEPFCFVHPIISEARKQAVPEGYIVVPIQLTADMSEAFDSCKRSDCEFADTFWEAMLSAAPQPDAAIRAKGN